MYLFFMTIITEHEFENMKKELEAINSLVGFEAPEILQQRKKKLLNRLEKSKQARIKRAGLRLL